MPSGFPHKTQIKTPDNSPAPTHLLMACIGCVRAVLMTYDPTLPMVHYRMTGCNYVTCHCVVKAFIGKTSDGRMAYFDFDFDDIDLKNETCKKILSGTDLPDMWTGQAPHAIEFWFDHYKEARIMLQDYARQTADPVFRRYFLGVNPQIVRLPLHRDLFATQDPGDTTPLHASIDTLRAIKCHHTPYVGDLSPAGIGCSVYRSREDDVRINELSFSRWRKWLLAGGSLEGDGQMPLAIYGRYYNPAHEDPTYWVY
jgi:hypothetical protein